MTRGRPLRVLLVAGARPSAAAARVRSDLQARGHDVAAVDGAHQAAAQARQRSTDVVLVDDATVDVTQVRTALGSTPSEVLALSVLETPDASLVLEQAAEIALRALQADRLTRRLAFCEPREPFLTGDPALTDALASLERLAGSAAAVLFIGERGTGRELLARTLHHLSPRADGPFVVLDPGRNQGAADGGVLELAEGGVLFVRHVENLSQDLQGELVRIVDHPRPHLRLLASSASDPDHAAHAGHLRRDLAERLAARIHVPPLRERPGDVGLLAAAFAHRASGRRLTPAAVLLLQKQHWPGNVRELRLVVERAALVSVRDPLEPDDLLLPGGATWASSALRQGLTLADVERDYIQTVLASHDGHRGHTARTLGIDPKTLYNKLGTDRPRTPRG